LSEREQHNWEERREQLSALLDNELPAAERARLEAHLQSCAACRAELESLRRASALLRALPQPALPRSFLLPLEPAAQQRADNLAQPARPAPTPLNNARTNRLHRNAKNNRLRRSAQVVRWLSTVAAVLGLLLLLGSAFTNLAYFKRGASTAANAPASSSQNTPTQSGGTVLDATPPPQSTAKSTTTQDRATPTGTRPSPEATLPGNGFDGSGTPAPSPGGRITTSSESGFTLSTPELGLLLLGLGVVGFVAAAILRRR
jgi:hypothetical protein